MNIRELKQQRAALLKQAREILDKAEQENRDLTAEESQEFDRITAEADAIGKRIEREERLASFPAMDDMPEPVAGRRGQPGAGPSEARMTNPRGTEEYRNAFFGYVRLGRSGIGPEEVRVLQVGVDADGGYLVPDEFQRELVEALEEQNVMRQLARVIQTGSGDRIVPVVVDRGTASWIGENAAYPEADAEFSQFTLGAHKLARITRVSEELLNDSAFDIAAFLRDAFARAFGDAEESAFVNGDGTGKPRGVLIDAQVGKTTASGTAIAADELIDLFHALKPPYRARATWLMHDSTVAAVRKLKDTTNQYIWQPGLQAGQPDMLLGRPVRVSRYMPEIGAGAKTVAFGDFSYYWIADRQSIGIQRLVELYAANGQVGFRMFTRLDGRLALAEAVQVLQQAAASGPST